VGSADRTAGPLDNARTFYFSNIIPQAADNNQGPWAALETHLGDLARGGTREVYIIAGAAGSKGTVKDEGRITIPAWTWKVAVILPRDAGLAQVTSPASVEVIAVLMPNDAGIRTNGWQQYRVSVDRVEQVSGYDLLAALPDALEAIIEAATP
jgi:endonuclease G